MGSEGWLPACLRPGGSLWLLFLGVVWHLVSPNQHRPLVLQAGSSSAAGWGMWKRKGCLGLECGPGYGLSLALPPGAQPNLGSRHSCSLCLQGRVDPLCIPFLSPACHLQQGGQWSSGTSVGPAFFLNSSTHTICTFFPALLEALPLPYAICSFIYFFGSTEV